MKFSYSLLKRFLPGAPQKKKLIEALNLRSFEAEDSGGDCVEIALPANRYSDAASHLGIVREAAAIFGLKFQNPVKTIVNPPADQGFLEVEIKNPKLCGRYMGRYFEIKNPKKGIGASPPWMRKVLKTCGLKPINAVVDLMNYVMLETGQPLHAFDFDRLSAEHNPNPRIYPNAPNKKKIIVRLAKKGEKIETLDGQKLILAPDTLLIADSKRPLAIAGIKGGVYAGIAKRTKRIIVEAANFDSVNIFQTSRKLKLLTDAAIRFSHNLSPALAQSGMDRATEFLAKMGWKLIDSVDIYPNPAGEELIEFDSQKYEKLIGAPISLLKAEKYFKLLGFSIETRRNAEEDAERGGYGSRVKPRGNQHKAAFLVKVPPWRTDIENFEDLAEEVSRLEGYNALKPKPPLVGLKPATEEDIIVFKDKIRNILVNFQLDEVYNYSFIGDADIRGQSAERGGYGSRVKPRGNQHKAALVELENPISREFKYLRPTLEAGLLKAVIQNSRFFPGGGAAALGGDKIRIFEIGKVFKRSANGVLERLSLGIALAAKKQSLILELKGIVAELLKSVGFMDFLIVEAGGRLNIESGKLILGNIKTISLPASGWSPAGAAAPRERASGGEGDWETAVCEINLDKLLELVEEEREFKPLPKYPSIIRDISVLVSGEARIGDIIQLIQEANLKLIEDVDLIDEYMDEKLGGRQSLTFRIFFRAEDRTLTDAEVNLEMEKIGKVLRKKFHAEIR